MDINGLPMTLLFTPEELVQYLYNETSQEKAAAIETALQYDWSLREKLDVLRASSNSLNRALESPRSETILYALNYARETFAESVQDR
jgi:hypothetical protein